MQRRATKAEQDNERLSKDLNDRMTLVNDLLAAQDGKSPSPPTKTKDPERNDLCVICMEKPRDLLIKPCNHFILCGDCGDNKSKVIKDCPICRQHITKRQTVILS